MFGDLKMQNLKLSATVSELKEQLKLKEIELKEKDELLAKYKEAIEQQNNKLVEFYKKGLT